MSLNKGHLKQFLLSVLQPTKASALTKLEMDGFCHASVYRKAAFHNSSHHL